jgi:rhodanese-related sulfurtransferase
MALTKEGVQEQIGKGAVVLNVLGEKAYEEVHIKGSFNIPLKGKSDDEFTAIVEKQFGKDKLIITHCSNLGCTAGPRAASILKNKGFKAEDYPGGIEDWNNAGLPVDVTKTAVPTA